MSREDFKPLAITPDSDLAEELRKNLTADHCVRTLFDATVEMAAAIGVTVTYEVHNIDPDMEVDQERLSKAIGRVATAQGAMLAGGGVNAIAQLKAQDPMKILREKRQKGGCKDVS